MILRDIFICWCEPFAHQARPAGEVTLLESFTTIRNILDWKFITLAFHQPATPCFSLVVHTGQQYLQSLWSGI